MHTEKWTPVSWKNYPIQQQPVYPDEAQLQHTLETIHAYPALVSSGEIELLRQQIALAARGERFILQGGDCAERFIDCKESIIANKIKILLQMSVILTHGLRRPIVRIGRIAGQYAKPRSQNTELIHGLELPNYRGDCVNGFPATAESRAPQPGRLLKAYNHSAITLNYIRSLIDGGFADLHNPYTWNLHSIESTTKWPQYKNIVDRILEAIHFMEMFGGVNSQSLGKIEFYTSHEGLLLDYEQALTRFDKERGKYYNLGAHMLWIGERTRHLGNAHIEYFRGIANPIGIKIGPTVQTVELCKILDTLNPENEAGRIILITRLGEKNVQDVLPELIKSVKSSGHNVAWTCDPMHGNLVTLDGGQKTRKFTDILSELTKTYKTHQRNNSSLVGAHFELTGEEVTECIGGALNLNHDDLLINYESYCDPRLNYIQSLEVAFALAALNQHEKSQS
ncbi:MAG: 3-deoxy-7-phosphoheptulonate synthase [Deferribacteres bacterium]|nr:3-deoxy-7-phosphoheptulonate synthase [candidate division KSB1 bacterium]MCB9500454.1 3-deoxy-7-phosphoheptulonate synthase [Deferribacteres bacterium]